MEEPTCYELLLTPSRPISLAKLQKTDLISMLTENNSIIGDKGKRYEFNSESPNESVKYRTICDVLALLSSENTFVTSNS